MMSWRNSTSPLGGETIREQYEAAYNQVLKCVGRRMSATGIRDGSIRLWSRSQCFVPVSPLPGRDGCVCCEGGWETHLAHFVNLSLMGKIRPFVCSTAYGLQGKLDEWDAETITYSASSCCPREQVTRWPLHDKHLLQSS